MPTYALLGATGGTGSAILRYLLEVPLPNLKLKILVRSKSKLLKTFPDLEKTSPFGVEVFEGTPDDNASLQNCLEGAQVVFMCIATNESKPTTTICYDVTAAIITALEALRAKSGSAFTRPTILQLRSANLNKIATEGYAFIGAAVRFCLYYVYSDLEKGCVLLEGKTKEDPSLLEYVFVDPPGLHDANGTKRTGHELLVDKAGEQNLMYGDLGAGFCEIAERRDEYKGKAVMVSATGEVDLTMGVLVGFVGTGLKSRIWG
ncbi:hypothetical protein LTR78_000193 [Recurvomyces mirabilis]|uniref:NAD(P)-binding domain-containing protein n=1 Tax=Recurvomyces mirabilis TaxID=574656 RepID=A0AAE1C6B2_9PEZI|nr:hypothetical protein LTR78_000193 [Recurvomyces mirabilis]KAK5161850.1 hypothetical protein LTS14_000195 [Recurvomyces mirabilis]